MTARLIHQVSGTSEEFGERLEQLLKRPKLQRVRFSVAYARWDGIGIISHAIEAFLAKGGYLETVYGAGNGVTTADALLYGLYLNARFPKRTYAGFIEDTFANAIFHLKLYEFRFEESVIVIIGSANLTGGGLARNGEIGVELTLPIGDPVEKALAACWKATKAVAKKVTAGEVRRLAASRGAGRERDDEVGGAKAGKPYLATKAKAAPKPLFTKILALPPAKNAKKSDLLGQMDSLSEKPKYLYLQIMERETGGQKGKSGSAVQLPVATLGAYFGMRSDEARVLTIRFPTEEVTTRVIHNSNHTHQVRLSPIFAVKRPAIIRFERVGPDAYKAIFVSPSRYQGMLQKKCLEQRRKGARKWGMF